MPHNLGQAGTAGIASPCARSTNTPQVSTPGRLRASGGPPVKQQLKSMSAASDKNIDRQKLNSIHIGSHRYAPLLRPGSSFSRRSASTSRHLSGGLQLRPAAGQAITYVPDILGIFHGLPPDRPFGWVRSCRGVFGAPLSMRPPTLRRWGNLITELRLTRSVCSSLAVDETAAASANVLGLPVGPGETPCCSASLDETLGLLPRLSATRRAQGF